MIIRWSHVNGEINLLGKMAAFQTLSSSPSFPMTRRELLCWSPKTRWISQRKARCFHCTDESGGQGKPWNLCCFGCRRGLLRLCTRIIYIIWFMVEKWLANLSNYLVDCFRSKKHRDPVFSGFSNIFQRQPSTFPPPPQKVKRPVPSQIAFELKAPAPGGWWTPIRSHQNRGLPDFDQLVFSKKWTELVGGLKGWKKKTFEKYDIIVKLDHFPREKFKIFETTTQWRRFL